MQSMFANKHSAKAHIKKLLQSFLLHYIFVIISNPILTHYLKHTLCVPKFSIFAHFALAITISLHDNQIMKRTRLNIFSYTDFRAFMHDRLKELKSDDSKYSGRYIAARLSLGSRNYLRMLIDGKRNMSDKLLRNMPTAFGLDKEEDAYFKDLVRFGQAVDQETKNEALENLKRHKKFLEVHQLSIGYFDYMSDPVALALREMTQLDDFCEDIGWIQSKLAIKAGKKRICDAIEKLETIGLLYRDKDDKLDINHKHQITGDQLGSTPLRAYHTSMLKQGIKSMQLPTDIRHYGGITISIPKESYGKIVNKFEAFMDEVRNIVDESNKQDDVYHLEMTLFPLTKPKDLK